MIYSEFDGGDYTVSYTGSCCYDESWSNSTTSTTLTFTGDDFPQSTGTVWFDTVRETSQAPVAEPVCSAPMLPPLHLRTTRQCRPPSRSVPAYQKPWQHGRAPRIHPRDLL